MTGAERILIRPNPPEGVVVTWPHVGDIVEHPAGSGQRWTVVEWREADFILERRPPIPRRYVAPSNRKSKNKSRGAGA